MLLLSDKKQFERRLKSATVKKGTELKDMHNMFSFSKCRTARSHAGVYHYSVNEQLV